MTNGYRPFPRALMAGSALILASALGGCMGCFGGTGSQSVAQSQWAPMPLQAAHLDEDAALVPAKAQTVQAKLQQSQYVVKVKDGEAEALSRLYFRDPAAAEASFREWAADRPLFRDMELVSCTYGGEFVLRPKAATRSLSARSDDDLLAALRAHPLVAYADPDFVAQAEGPAGRAE